MGNQDTFHRRFFEASLPNLAIVTTVAISIGGLVEITPMFSALYDQEALEQYSPYTPLEVAGRDIYVREGCYNCHSQMIRPFRAETLRYGAWTRAEEYAFDRPFQLGSRRIGPDLQRVGGKYPDAWHYEHMKDPRSTSPGSIMPPYPWLYEDSVDPEDIEASVTALATLGTPYSTQDIAGVAHSLETQGKEITKRLAEAGVEVESDREIVALIAYLQRLGKDGKAVIAAQEEARKDGSAYAGGAE
jgi:cytochrome c oxidase cbb3-type subunit I/II